MTSLLMSSPPISISHRLFRCRYSNSKDVVARSPSFSRPDASAPEGGDSCSCSCWGETERMRLFHGNIQILFQLKPPGCPLRQKQQGKLHRQRNRTPSIFGNKGYTIYMAQSISSVPIHPRAFVILSVPTWGICQKASAQGWGICQFFLKRLK